MCPHVELVVNNRGRGISLVVEIVHFENLPLGAGLDDGRLALLAQQKYLPSAGDWGRIAVNVETVFNTKVQMLARHKSQREWLLKHHGIDDYLEMMERWTRETGRRTGVELAEGFRRYKGHPYPRTPLLEELLAAFVV